MLNTTKNCDTRYFISCTNWIFAGDRRKCSFKIPYKYDFGRRIQPIFYPSRCFCVLLTFSHTPLVVSGDMPERSLVTRLGDERLSVVSVLKLKCLQSARRSTRFHITYDSSSIIAERYIFHDKFPMTTSEQINIKAISDPVVISCPPCNSSQEPCILR